MPIWLIVVISVLGWSIWPAIVIILHVCEEKERKKNMPKGKQFLSSLKEDKKK